MIIHRLQGPLPLMYLAYAVWGVSFGIGDFRALLSVPALAAVVANLFLICGGLVLNTAVDLATDQRHAGKKDLAHAGRRVGRRGALCWAVGELSAGLLVALIATIASGYWLPVVCAAVIVLLHVLYNVEPIRLKHRGFIGAVCFAAGLPTVPSLLSYSSVHSGLETTALVTFAGLGILTVGRTAWWSVPDHQPDREAGARTAAVRYGIARATATACAIMTTGLVIAGTVMGLHYGPIKMLISLAPHLIVLGAALRPLMNGTRAVPTMRSMRRQTIPLVTLGEVLIAALPLATL
ncbi:hypothetical protein GKO32_15015 [Amycolatopsis sp. RM579]|uniref:Prenyltransferase n=2 Tax=Amycolatopsis pithecellobii TaxID=664692 RepID=A0A6N7Z2S9_9PSEU|nr:hypothetical protein [Amycolatopsis pithecellobii]